ncbi:MAG: hypothetical protein ACK5WZ_03550 [Pseudobdellovibrionaceae bacterium]
MRMPPKRFKDHFQFYLGIDQTGAVQPNGLARPLRCSLFFHQQIFLFSISRFSLDEIDEGIIQILPKKIKDSYHRKFLFILLDSVLGLPRKIYKSADENFFDYCKLARNFSFDDKFYGAVTANSFYLQFLDQTGNKEIPKRTCEVLTKANSVFKMTPFQKNISCGTYRILRELDDIKNIHFFHLQKNPNFQKPMLAEGYPSLYWREFIQSRSRDLSYLKPWLKSLQVKTNQSSAKLIHDPDYADATVLALTPWLIFQGFTSTNLAFEKFNDPQEGWIFALKKK